jgi:hypothetical protein
MPRGHDARQGLGFAVATYLAVWAALAAAPSTPALGSELDALYSQVLQRPGDTELNLRFARLAEDSGNLRWALSAYERVVLNDPASAEGLAGLTRIKRRLQPNTTLVTLQLGAQYESNPSYYLPPHRGEAQFLGSGSLLDERSLDGVRWRTTALVAGILHGQEQDLNYAVAGFDTGPVLDAFPGWSFHPALGAGAAYFDDHFYYAEGSAGVTFDSLVRGIYRAIEVRGAYRSYDQFFPSGQGFYVLARGKLAVPGLLGPDSVVIASPWVIWSDLNGSTSVIVPIITALQPGSYWEWGGRIDFIKSLGNNVVLNLNVWAAERDFRNDRVLTTMEKRRDRIVSPGASLTFPNLFGNQTDLRLEYRFIDDFSNDPTKSFTDHVATASIIARFDPTLPSNRMYRQP